jgi:hypothetical protein
MLHVIERTYPALAGCSWFVLILLLWSGTSLLLYSFTRWTEWFIGFLAGALFALPFLMEFGK